MARPAWMKREQTLAVVLAAAIVLIGNHLMHELAETGRPAASLSGSH